MDRCRGDGSGARYHGGLSVKRRFGASTLFGTEPGLAAPDTCTTSNDVTTCAGDQSEGMANSGGTGIPEDAPRIEVKNLTKDIGPVFTGGGFVAALFLN